MYFIGIDQSLTNTGVCVLRYNPGISTHFLGSFKSKPIKTPGATRSTLDLLKLRRIDTIVDDVISQLKKLDISEPPFVAIESPSFSVQNVDLSILYGKMADRLWDWVYECPPDVSGIDQVIIVMPTELKSFVTGKGNADKDAMVFATSVRDHNQADAFGLATLALFMKTGVIHPCYKQGSEAHLKKLAQARNRIREHLTSPYIKKKK